jgi:hypothetical protein
LEKFRALQAETGVVPNFSRLQIDCLEKPIWRRRRGREKRESPLTRRPAQIIRAHRRELKSWDFPFGFCHRNCHRTVRESELQDVMAAIISQRILQKNRTQ